VCLGRETKNIDTYMGLDKEYTGSIRIGATTASFDLETPEEKVTSTGHVSYEHLLNAAKRLTGEQMQVPPVYSAIRKDGARAYDAARSGKKLELDARRVFVHEFEIVSAELPDVKFRVVCSKGTYIRALARDFGEMLGTGAYLSQLCRTRIGRYHLSEAMSIEEAIQELEA
jgi:tRNA pseudouridine55 synthase